MIKELHPIRQRFSVAFAYEAYFTRGLFETDNPILAEVISRSQETLPKRMLVTVDDGVVRCHPQLLAQIVAYASRYQEVLELPCEPLVIAGGEQCKNSPELPQRIQRCISELGLCRHSYVMAVGGGALLDMVGYAAATAHRGIRLIRAPTTVLSQNDSGVGVKNGVNAFGKKNFLGVFAPPQAVLNDFAFLTTLDDRDWRAGVAEAIKVALIKDGDFFEFIEAQAELLKQRQMAPMEQVIYRCARLHMAHIASSGDPFEFGSSRPLDFGHWSAHKLEPLTAFTLRHGEAVAIGIALDSVYSYLGGLLPETDMMRVLRVLQVLGFRLYVPELEEYIHRPEHPRCIFKGLDEFREHLGGNLTLMLLAGIGRGVEVNQVDTGLYRHAVQILASFS